MVKNGNSIRKDISQNWCFNSRGVKYMKAKLGTAIIICILVSFTFGACFNMSAGSMLNYRLRHIGDDDALIKESASKSFEIIRNAVEEKDSDAIYELFSKTAKDSGITKESIDVFIDVLYGNLKNWERLGLHSSEKNEYGVRKIVYDIPYSITVGSEPYVLVFEECVRDDKNEGNMGLWSLILFFDDEDLGMPREYVGDYGVYIFTKEEVLGFKDELLKQREEEWAREEAEEAAAEEAYEKEIAEKIKAEEEKEKKEKEKAKKEKEKKKKNSIRKTVGKKWKSLKKKSD